MTDLPRINPEEPPASAIPEKSPQEGFFRNPAVLFGFFRVCLYLILSNGIGIGLSLGTRSLVHANRDPYSPRNLMIGETVALIGALAAALIMSRLEHQPFGAYGLPVADIRRKFFWQGTLFGLTEISAVIGSAAVLGAYHFGPIAIHGAQLLRWVIFWVVFFVCVGLYEEFAFRGYVQFTLARGIGFWPAAILLSIMFGATHRGNPGETLVGIASIVFAGIFWCFTLRRTGNLWFAVGMHASFDFGETFLYSVPDSGVVFPGHLSNATLAGPTWITGGSAGPEASVFDFLVLAILLYAFHRLYPPKSGPNFANVTEANANSLGENASGLNA